MILIFYCFDFIILIAKDIVVTDKEKIGYKTFLKGRALEILHERINTSYEAMREAQVAANEEGKSSVGDKYETSRAMAQIDRDIHARQLESSQKELTFVQQLDVSMFRTKIDAGSFVETDMGKYFFLSGIGQVDTGIEKIFFLSMNSPIGKIFSGKEAGAVVLFNGKKILIKAVF